MNKGTELHTAGSDELEAPAEIESLKPNDAVTKLLRHLASGGTHRVIVKHQIYLSAFSEASLIDALSKIHFWYTPDRRGNSRLLKPDKFGVHWLSFTRFQWSEQLGITTRTLDRTFNKLVKLGIIEKRVFRNSQGLAIVHIRAIRCGGVNIEPHILGKYDHLLQHLPGFEFDLKGKRIEAINAHYTCDDSVPLENDNYVGLGLGNSDDEIQEIAEIEGTSKADQKISGGTKCQLGKNGQNVHPSTTKKENKKKLKTSTNKKPLVQLSGQDLNLKPNPESNPENKNFKLSVSQISGKNKVKPQNLKAKSKDIGLEHVEPSTFTTPKNLNYSSVCTQQVFDITMT